MNKIALKDFLQYQFLSDVNYAPDGKAAALVVKRANEEANSYRSNIWIYEDSKLFQLTGMDQESLYFWEDPEHILFQAVRSPEDKKRVEAKEEFSVFYRIGIHGGEAVRAFEVPFTVTGIKQIKKGSYAVLGSVDAKYPDYYKMSKEERQKVADFYKDEEDYEVITELPFYANGGGFNANRRTALFLADETGKCCKLTEAEFECDSVDVKDDRICYVGESYEGKPTFKSKIYCYNLEDGSDHCIYQKCEYNIHNVFWCDNQIIVVGTDESRYGLNENPYLYRLNEENGELTIWAKSEECIGSSVGSDCRLGGGRAMKSVDGNIYLTRTLDNHSGLHMITQQKNAGVKEQSVLDREGSVDTFDVAAGQSEILLVGMFDGKLQELYSLDVKSQKLTQLSQFNEEILKGKYVAEYEKITVMSQGRDIDGWILKPIDYDPNKKYPAILDVHGGPKTVYGEVFYHEMQFWANEGYFVFFCNPTGSDGRGNDFADIRGKYGTIDYENIMDFTDAVLTRYEQIDRNRVGVTGGSYGGFMTNWIIGHTNRFAAAATQRSISNWVSFYGISDIGFFFGTDQTGGDIYENVEKMWFHSPLKYAANITTPTLFIHSNEDYRCPMAEGMQLYTALADRGIDTRMCYFKGENHELSRSGKPKHRVRRLTEITNWIEKYTR